MRRFATRVLLGLVGAVMLLFYLGLGYLGYRVFATLWAGRPDLTTTVAVLLLTTLFLGYLSYQFGTARLLSELGATEIPRERAPELYRLVDSLADRMDTPAPRLFVASMDAPNALAVGGSREGDIVLDGRLFRLLDAEEIEVLLAHELAHLESHDGFIQTLGYSLAQTVGGLLTLLLLPIAVVVAGVARALAYLRGDPPGVRAAAARVHALVGSVVVLLMVAFTLLLRAHSRRREYLADDRAVEVTGNPGALADALRKIERAASPDWGVLSPLYIHGDEQGLMTRLLATHPPMDERVARLRKRVPQPQRIEIR
ncbi:M48 family metallopeptidase [Natronomonas sp. EA1]|uniref:M48 family metallopeptidase n=1 Tax=Natronomonas sp. EA1 TaxID=3421655 RepID=UPI003EC1520D